MFGRKRKSNIKKQVRKRYKALKKSGDVKLGKEAGLSKKEMKEGIRKNIAEKGVLRRRNVMAKKASDRAALQKTSAEASRDMATERANRAADREMSMQAKATATRRDIEARKTQGSENERVRANRMAAGAAKPGGIYEMIMPDGTKKMVRKPEMAQEGAKVKNKTNKSFKNSVGVKPGDVNKIGPKNDPDKRPYTENGITYTYDPKSGNWLGDLDKDMRFATLQREIAAKKKSKKEMKHGGALAIVVAPVKTKKMKAVKKAKMGAKMKEVPSDAKGLSKLPKSIRNKMGYMKHGGKVKAMYGAKMKKKAMYGAKMKKK